MRLLAISLCTGIAIASVAGCSAAKKIAPPAALEKGSVGTGAAKRDTLTMAKPDSLTGEETKQLRKILDELRDIPFDLDKCTIPTQGSEIIKADIVLLNSMLESRGKYIHITLEGNCDERGSEEYNLALGEKRANTVREYLLTVGFQDKSLKTVSYGKERPKIQGHTEEAWAANRRVHIVVE